MKYFLLLANPTDWPAWDEATPEQQQEEMGKHIAFSEACATRENVELVSGEALQDASTATTLRTKDGDHMITDGPFAEAAEHIGGYYVIDAPDLDTVIELCWILPAYDIEIRPVISFD